MEPVALLHLATIAVGGLVGVALAYVIVPKIRPPKAPEGNGASTAARR